MTNIWTINTASSGCRVWYKGRIKIGNCYVAGYGWSKKEYFRVVVRDLAKLVAMIKE